MVSRGLGVSAALTSFIAGAGLSSFIFGGIMVVGSSIITVPGGALLGSIHAQAAEGEVVEYVIGDGEWVIVK